MPAPVPERPPDASGPTKEFPKNGHEISRSGASLPLQTTAPGAAVLPLSVLTTRSQKKISSFEDLDARGAQVHDLLVVEEHVHHRGRSGVSDVDGKLGAGPRVHSGVRALPWGLLETLSDDELVILVLKGGDAVEIVPPNFLKWPAGACTCTPGRTRS